MTYISFDQDSRMLYEYDNDEVTYVWTFEKYLNEPVTPSMYHFMAGYVLEHWATQGYDAEPNAVDAYFEVPIRERIMMHEQELVNLRAAKREAEAKESAAIDAMLEENRPFDNSSPINYEYCEFMRSLISKYRQKAQQFDRMMYEEELWRGGHEEGESDCE